MRESTVEKALVKGVKAKGGLCLKWVSPGCRGVPDRIVIYRGRTTYVELKRPGSTLDPRQVLVHTMLRAQHVPVYTLSTIDEVDAFLQRHV